MKRKPLYGRATRRRSGPSILDGQMPADLSFSLEDNEPSLAVVAWRKARAFASRHDRSLPAAAAVLVSLAVVGGWWFLHPGPSPLTQWDIDNAVKYNRAGGRVKIDARKTDGDFRIVFADSGTGIRPEEKAQIFERFYRAPNQDKRTGAGLGLAIAREIVVAHGGSIACTSAEGQGSEFYFMLPR